MRQHHRLMVLGGAMALLCSGLALWQVQRLGQKEALIQAFEQQAKAAPTPWDGAVPPSFAPLQVNGVGHIQRRLQIIGRLYKGKPGYHLVVPKETPHGILLMDLGWVAQGVPLEAACVPDTRSVTCRAREFPPPPAWFMPQNRPEAGVFTRLNRHEIAALLGQPVAPFYCESIGEGGSQPPCSPRPVGAQRPDWHNHHLGYALTWAALALIGLGMVILGFRRRKSKTPLDNTAKMR